ncbi:MAG: hypothetical protein WCC60_14925 [Ilumatobacteraceae bacterium]
MSILDEHVDQILLSHAEALAAVAEWERRGALLALALRHVERSGTFGSDGSITIKEWLRDHARMTSQGAGELLALGRFLDTNTAFAEAAVTGQLSGGQLAVARRLGRPKFAALLAEQQQALVDTLTTLDIHDTVKAVEHWRNCAEALIDDDAPPLERPCELTFGRTLDDRLHGNLSLHDAAATEFEKAIHNAVTHDGEGDDRSLAERQGDALFDIAAFFNKNHENDGTPRNLPTVSLSADLSTITSKVPEGVDDDTQRPLTPACTDTYLCDCKIHAILRDANGIRPQPTHRAPHPVPSDRRPRRRLPLPRLPPPRPLHRRPSHHPLATWWPHRLRQPPPAVLAAPSPRPRARHPSQVARLR